MQLSSPSFRSPSRLMRLDHARQAYPRTGLFWLQTHHLVYRPPKLLRLASGCHYRPGSESGGLHDQPSTCSTAGLPSQCAARSEPAATDMTGSYGRSGLGFQNRWSREACLRTHVPLFVLPIDGSTQHRTICRRCREDAGGSKQLVRQ